MNKSSYSSNPLILVHGLWDTPKVFKSLISYLDPYNIDIYAPFIPHKYGSIPLYELGLYLNKLIVNRFGETLPIDILGFSMGGIVSRVWLQLLGGSLRTNKFLSVGSPHNGTYTAKIFPPFYFSGIEDMKPKSNLLVKLDETSHMLEPVICKSYYCKYDLMVFPGWRAVLPIGDSFELNVPTHKDLIIHKLSLSVLSDEILSSINQS